MEKRQRTPSETAERNKILIVDDHPIMRAGLRNVINREPDLAVCGVAENARQAMEAIQKQAPALVLVDLTLPGKSGLELIKEIKGLHPHLAILVISMHDETLYARWLLHAGANGYITKQQPPRELVKAIRQVLDHQIYVSQEVSNNLLSGITGQPNQIRSPMENLTHREVEILRLVGEGKSSTEIAGELHISGKTVDVHSANIRQKLNQKSNAQMIRFALHLEDFTTLMGN